MTVNPKCPKCGYLHPVKTTTPQGKEFFLCRDCRHTYDPPPPLAPTCCRCLSKEVVFSHKYLYEGNPQGTDWHGTLCLCKPCCAKVFLMYSSTLFRRLPHEVGSVVWLIETEKKKCDP